MIDRREIEAQAIERYGMDHQIIKAIEEMSELTTELAKSFLPGGTTVDLIAEEMADVAVVLEELQLMFEITDDRMAEIMASKLQRLEQRMEAGDVC